MSSVRLRAGILVSFNVALPLEKFAPGGRKPAPTRIHSYGKETDHPSHRARLATAVDLTNASIMRRPGTRRCEALHSQCRCPRQRNQFAPITSPFIDIENTATAKPLSRGFRTKTCAIDNPRSQKNRKSGAAHGRSCRTAECQCNSSHDRQCVGRTSTGFNDWALIHPLKSRRHGNASACGTSLSITASSRSRPNGAVDMGCHMDTL